MGFERFSARDFEVFAISGFQGRMGAIRGRVRPKLESLGEALLPDLARLAGDEVFAHVAKHARRTVNPPDDTWVAFGPDRRGYKKAQHFKVAISRHATRFLFEIGPEHAEKRRWAAAWKLKAPKLAPALKAARGLAWFRNEHDEEPRALLADLSAGEITGLADELTRTRDGQLVLGRRAGEAEVVTWGPEEYRAVAVATFTPLAPLYRLG